MQRSSGGGLSIEVNTSQAQQNLNSLNTALQRTQSLGASTASSITSVGGASVTASRGVSSLGGASTTATSGASSLGRASSSASSSISGLGSSASSASSSISSLGSASSGASSSITSLSGVSSSSIGGIGGFSSAVSGAHTSLLRVAGIAGAVVGGVTAIGGAFLGAVSSVAQADAEIRILSERANTSAQNMQVLAQGASTFGVSMDQLGSILADAQEKLGEFTATEGGGAADFFDAMKNNTKLTEDQIRSLGKTMSGKDGIEAIRDMVTEMDKMGASSQEQRFVLESLGSDLGNLQPLLSMNKQEWEEYGQALTDAGVIRTEESIQKSVELVAQQKALENRFQGVKNQIADALMPVMMNLIDSFSSGAQGGVKLDGVLQVVGVTAKALGGAFRVLGGVISAFGQIINGFINSGKIIGETMAKVVMADGVLEKGKALWGGLKDQVGNVGSTAYNALADIGDGVTGVYDIFAETKGETDKLAKAYQTMMAKNTTSAKGFGKSTKEADEEEKKSKEKLAKARDEANKKAQEALRLEQELQRLRDNISTDYMNVEEKRQADYEKRIADIKKAFSGSEQQRYISLADDRLAKEKAVTDAKLAYDLVSWKNSEEDKITKSATLKLAELERSQDYSDEDKKIHRKSIIEKMEFELEEHKKTQELKKQQLDKQISDYAGSASGITFEASLIGKTDDQKDTLRLKNQFLESQKDLLTDYQKLQKDINDSEILSDTEKQQKLYEISKTYNDMKKADLMLYNEEVKALNTAQIVSQLDSYAIMFGSLGDMVKGYAGENSKAYQGMLLLQKSANLTSVIMNGYTAVSQAWASAPFPYNMAAVLQATTQTGILQASLQAITPNLTGMAHNGIGSVPREGTWLLDKGERVLNPQQNTDLTDFMADQKSRELSNSSNSSQNLRIINNLDPSLVGNFMQSPTGERTIMNSISQNATEIRELLGV